MEKTIYISSEFTKADAGDDGIYIEGYANTTDVDRAGDVILASAWQEGIQDYLKNPIILAYHDHSEPAGTMVDYKISDKGLWIKARISAASEIYGLVKDGVLRAFSVGFAVLEADYDRLTEIFVIKKVGLREISVVSVPCNQESIFSLSKSFESEEEFNKFKLQYAQAETLDKNQKPEEPTNNNIKGILDMDEKELQAMVEKATSEALAKANAEKAAADKAAAEKAAADAAIDAKIKDAVTSVKLGESGAEKLLADIEKKLEEKDKSFKEALEGLQAEIKEKAAEIEAMNKSKMRFSDKGDDAVTKAEKDGAVFLKMVLGRGNIADTKYGKQMLEKAGAHVPGAVPWELEVSTNMENEIRQRLVVQSLLRQVPMQTNVMKMPLNPATGLGQWVTNAQFGTTNSAGNTVTHQLSEITLSAYKVATNEYVGYEEEEDSILVLVPVIRDAMVRRLARSIDQAFLRGAGSGSDPVKGLATYATANTDVPVGTKVTVANLRTMRKGLGIFGLDPAEVTYVVSSDVYYDLLDDTTFMTMEYVGPKATLLTGQIGLVGNSPVVISGEFVTKAAGSSGVNVGAIAVNTANFVAGNQRGLRFDTQQLAETQRTVMVASMRTGMTQLTSAQGQAVSKLAWVA